jgi:hypothetical protein
MKKLSNIQNINMNKASMLLHFILLLMLTIGGLQQMLRINDYKWVTILYDLINFCTTMVIAYIVYVANGGRKRKKTAGIEVDLGSVQSLHEVYSETNSEIDEETEQDTCSHQSNRQFLPGSEEHKFKVFYNELEKQDSLSANLLCYISYRQAYSPGAASFFDNGLMESNRSFKEDESDRL